MKRIFVFLLILFHTTYSFAQFPPQAELPGSTAIYKDSNILIDWANQCSIIRGWMDIADTSLGKTSIGSMYSPLGKADSDVISLGDGGEAIYYLENPIINGQGYDFAIFENGFMSPEDSALAYLELATVSVSNDGIVYTSFDAICNNDTLFQIPGFGEYMNATKIHHLAGKYKHDYGTPFDLSDLDTSSGIKLNAIHFVKVKDVIGTIHPSFCTRDKNGRKINDPYPTPFPSGGFDLDALGIMHHLYPTSTSISNKSNNISLYPNPASTTLYIETKEDILQVEIYSINGIRQPIEFEKNSSSIQIANLPTGLYLLRVLYNNGLTSFQYFNKYE